MFILGKFIYQASNDCSTIKNITFDFRRFKHWKSTMLLSFFLYQ